MDQKERYPRSVREARGETVYMLRDAAGEDRLFYDGAARPLDHAAAEFLREAFPWAAPSRVLALRKTFGVGDRLGLAGPGHLRCFADTDAVPVLAQQSVRELALTGRSFADVLDAATFAVFREGYRAPWGADGDHLKSFAEIEAALACGCTMLTLDCSGSIGRGGEPTAQQRALYLQQTFHAEDAALSFDEAALRECAAVYGDALDFITRVYERYILRGGVDFEISIDETDTPTTPLQHYFVASELTRRGVVFQTLAPRFCGAFQKGVDYRGDLAQFEAEIAVHAAIARAFGYKLSIHSGSDKLSVYPLIARYTRGCFHVKTAGTNWLEAMKLVAQKTPGLYRQAHAMALAAFPEACAYYQVSTDLRNIPALNTLPDEALPALFDNPDARQLLHITYGQLLRSPLRTRLFSLWQREQEAYFALLRAHIGRHLALLNGENL